MELKQFFSEKKKHVMRALQEELKEREHMFSRIPRQGEFALKRLHDFSTRGKNVRGSMVLLAHEMLGGKNEQGAKKAAVAMELTHTSFLVHDDIIDRDELRRGKLTIHAQYREDAEKEHIRDAQHFGYSQAICVGDISLFLSFDILNSIKDGENLFHTFIQEVTNVAIAEMEDVYLGHTTTEVQEKDIILVNRYKTARYTFSLPLLLGAKLANADEKIQKQLMELGETMGILFQIRDDDIGFFGHEEETGKPVGSDIQENKKTLHRNALYLRADQQQKELLDQVFGNTNADKIHIKKIQDLAEELSIPQYIEEEMQKWANEAREQLKELTIGEEWKDLFTQLIEYNLKRVK